MAPTPQRARLLFVGRKFGLFTRERVFRFPDGLQVDVVLGAQARCQRVFFDEVHLVTWHKTRGWAFLLATGILFGLTTGASLLAGLIGSFLLGLGVFAGTALPAAVAFFVRLARGLEVVTVYGKRGRAEMHFFLNKARAREVYHQVCRLVRERQERASREAPATATPLPPPFPGLSAH
jgi:hypothetical protein